MERPSLPRQPFVGLVLAAAIGIIAADFFPNASVTILLVIVGVAIVAMVRPALALTYLVVVAAFYLLHSAAITDTPGQNLAGRLGSRARTLRVAGTVVTEPKAFGSGPSSFLLQLSSIEFEGKTEPEKASILVRWNGEAQFGDEVNLFGVIEPIGPPRNPGEFDMRSYLRRIDVFDRLFVHYPEDGVVLHRGGGNRLLRLAHRARTRIQSILCRGLEDSPDVQNFISGLTLGLRHQTTDDIEEPFQQTGTLHLFAVAGLHVGIVANLLWLVASMLRLPRKMAAALIIPTLFFYACVTGLHISSVRAAIMAALLFAGVFFDRKVLAFNSLAAAAFILLAWNTQELFSTGFQLSFAVVGTIILLAEPLTRWLKSRGAPDPLLPKPLWGRQRRVAQAGVHYLGGASAVSSAAWFGSLILILWYLNLVTPVSLLANLAVVPIAFLILGAALLSLVSAPLSVWLSVVINNANWALATLVLKIVHLFAILPGGHYYMEHPRWPDGRLAQISVLDLGAGAAVHVRAGSENWFVDCGSEREYDNLVRYYLHGSGINRLDGLILTHGDSLHIGATPHLLTEVAPRAIFDNPLPDRSIVHRRIREEMKRLGVNRRDLAAGDSISLGSNLEGRVLYPLRISFASAVDDQSLVMQFHIRGGPRVLLMSDSGTLTENTLLRSGIDLRSDILIKGQNHSSASGSSPFLDAVQPCLIVATSRDFPEAEHIRDEWEEEVKRRGIQLFRQDRTGAVLLSFGPETWEARPYLAGEIFRKSNR